MKNQNLELVIPKFLNKIISREKPNDTIHRYCSSLAKITYYFSDFLTVYEYGVTSVWFMKSNSFYR